MKYAPYLLIVFLFGSTSCNNVRLKLGTSKTSTNVGATVANGPRITQVINNTSNITLFFDEAGPRISDYCNLDTQTATARPCLCNFEWTTQNTSGGGASSVGIPRSVSTTVTAVQPTSLVCTPPSLANVNDGTIVQIKAVGNAPANSSLQVEPFRWRYSLSGSVTACVAGNPNCLVDDTGNSYFNVLRYSCFEYYQKDIALRNARATATGASDQSVTVALANQFCHGDKASDAACQNVSDVQYTNQSNYFSLLARSDQPSFELQNANYYCPTVSETLNRGPSGSTFSGYPGSSSFMVSSQWSTDTPKGLVAPGVLGKSGSPSNRATSCRKLNGDAADAARDTTDNEIAQRCQGYVAVPTSEDRCAPIVRNSQLIPTYRLRRYIAKAPTIFKASGNVLQTYPVVVDEFYSLDRPINSGNAQDGFTMLGPKPCPYAYFDSKGATKQPYPVGDLATGVRPANVPEFGYSTAAWYKAGRPAYVGTNNPAWKDKNPDRIIFPNVDSQSGNYPVCSATLPIVNYENMADGAKMGLFTTHRTNINASTSLPNHIALGGGRTLNLDEIHVRGLEPFVLEYVEDPSFKACAPASTDALPAPTHFAVNKTGNAAYCEELFPTQNNNVGILDRQQLPQGGTSSAPVLPGGLKPFTSHVVVPQSLSNLYSCNNQSQSPALDLPTTIPGLNAYNLPPAPFQNPGTYLAALHRNVTVLEGTIGADKTCDRTVINTTTLNAFPRFPLLAEPAEVESALFNSSQYQCKVTYDAGNGKAGSRSPSGGCSALVPNVNSNYQIRIQAAPPLSEVGHTEPEHGAHTAPVY